MPDFDAELRECLEVILGSAAPAPEYEALLFYRQWLAARNLGLVPIADAQAFEWAGHWLARVRASDGVHAVVMFGVPSGPFHDPSHALERGATIEAGWLLARLDLHLPTEKPYGEDRGIGSVAGILTGPDATSPLARVERIEAFAGRGLQGDRYYEGRGTFSGRGQGYELTLVEAEALDSLELSWERARRNIVTRGISLNGLVGHRFRVGAVECIGRRLCEPCAHLEKLSGPGVLRPLVHRGGLRADILSGGPIALGDRVAVTD